MAASMVGRSDMAAQPTISNCNDGPEARVGCKQHWTGSLLHGEEDAVCHHDLQYVREVPL